jgi:hypothetical protein
LLRVNSDYYRRRIGWQIFGKASRGGRRGCETWEDKVGEEIDLEG